MTSPNTLSETGHPTPAPPSRKPRWGPKDQKLADGLLMGLSVKAAAEAAGMPYSTARRRRADAVWNRRFMEAEAEAVKEVTRRGVRSAMAALQVLERVAGNVKRPGETLGAAERPEARTQVYAASRILSAFVGMHGRAVADADSDLDLSTPTIEYVLVGVNTEALT